MAMRCVLGSVIITEKQIHRIIIEKHIGRELYNDEVVHHINGNKRNNHVGNLQVMKRGDHIALHNKLNPRRITKRNKVWPNSNGRVTI